MIGNAVVRSGRWVAVVLAGMLLTGCASQVAGSATAGPPRSTAAPSTSPPPDTTTETSTETTTQESTTEDTTTTDTTDDSFEAGPITGDPADVVLEADPTVDAKALTDYLLPGFSGPGVDCFVDQLDIGLLEPDVTVEDAAQQVVDLLYGCVEEDSVGLVLAMFAVGLDSETADQYHDLADCAGPGLADSSRAVEFDLLRIYQQELSPQETEDSAAIAQDALKIWTDCLDAAPSSSPEPPESGTPWEQLVTGQCVVEVPEGIVEAVEVVDCTQPHLYEVVGTSADLTAGDDPSATCQEATGAYLHPDVDLDLRINTLSSETNGVVAFACLVGTAGEPLTESLRG